MEATSNSETCKCCVSSSFQFLDITLYPNQFISFCVYMICDMYVE